MWDEGDSRRTDRLGMSDWLSLPVAACGEIADTLITVIAFLVANLSQSSPAFKMEVW